MTADYKINDGTVKKFKYQVSNNITSTIIEKIENFKFGEGV